MYGCGGGRRAALSRLVSPLRLQRRRLGCLCVPRSRSSASAAAAGAPWCSLPCKGCAHSLATQRSRRVVQWRASVPRSLWRIVVVYAHLWSSTWSNSTASLKPAPAFLVMASRPPPITPRKGPRSQRGTTRPSGGVLTPRRLERVLGVFALSLSTF